MRSERSAAALRGLGITPLVADLDAPPAAIDEAFDWLFHFAPPPTASPDAHDDPRTRHLLASLQRPPRRLVYLSTSAVYGDCAGRWIDETAPLAPNSARGFRRLAAERAVLDYAQAQGCAAMILRVPGIYGPGRLPVERLRSGTPILRREDAPYTNRIHADDLAAAAYGVAERGEPGAAYNVSDGQPTSMTDYFLRCARLLGLPEPPQLPMAEARAAFSPMLLSFLEESKRLGNRRLVEQIGWQPAYPDLDRGLPGCIEDDRIVSALRAPAYNSQQR
ncbi:MAG: SDR family oxidoreductase [Nevskia sp.]